MEFFSPSPPLLLTLEAGIQINPNPYPGQPVPYSLSFVFPFPSVFCFVARVHPLSSALTIEEYIHLLSYLIWIKESAYQCRRCGFDPRLKKIPWGRKRKPTPVFLPGKSHGQRSLVHYRLWGHKRVSRT